MHINIYLIITEKLFPTRKKYTNATLEKLCNILNSNNISTSVVKVSKPDTEDLNVDILKEIKLEKTGIENIDKFLSVISLEHISNIKKHITCYESIVSSGKDYNLILEDDILITKDYEENILHMIKDCLELHIKDWDILFCCISTDGTSLNNNLLSNVYDMYNTLPAKSSYFIKKSMASQLISYIDHFKYSMRGILNRFIIENKNNFKFKMYNKHTILEGSKIGIFPTTINNNNILFQNTDYMNLIKLLNSKELTLVEYNQAKTIENNLSQLQSPDVYHIMGIICHKMNNHKEALEFFEKALKITKEKNGLISKNSELLNNTINLFQMLQDDDIKLFQEKPSKWINSY